MLVRQLLNVTVKGWYICGRGCIHLAWAVFLRGIHGAGMLIYQYHLIGGHMGMQIQYSTLTLQGSFPQIRPCVFLKTVRNSQKHTEFSHQLIT